MTDAVRLQPEVARDLVVSVLEHHGTSAHNAASVARALVAAEIDGQAGHGLSRLPSYAAQSATGKVDGRATAVVVARKPAAVRIDARGGFAYPAMDLAIELVGERAYIAGVAAAAVYRSHHFGQAGYHVERLAERGIAALVFGNSPQAIAPWGGREGLFGTNPIAFAAPRTAGAPIVIDLSLSKVARGKVMVAAEENRPIPEGWALDADGMPTTDARAALAGTMLPMGDAKGAALVMMVEIIAAALTGANFGFEASSFFSAEGPPPGVGQLLLGFDPGFLAGGGFAPRLDELLDRMLAQPGVRVPGDRRLEARAMAADHGIEIPGPLHDRIRGLLESEG